MQDLKNRSPIRGSGQDGTGVRITAGDRPSQPRCIEQRISDSLPRNLFVKLALPGDNHRKRQNVARIRIVALHHRVRRTLAARSTQAVAVLLASLWCLVCKAVCKFLPMAE
jgi:hypothetical protein